MLIKLLLLIIILINYYAYKIINEKGLIKSMPNTITKHYLTFYILGRFR